MMMKRASEDGGSVGQSKRIVWPEPALPCTWKEMLRTWHGRGETLISALCMDVIDEIAWRCGPCQTRDYIEAFDLSLCLMRSQMQQTRWTALEHVRLFPASLWAAYGLVPTILADIQSALPVAHRNVNIPTWALSAFCHFLEELGSCSQWHGLLLASDALDVTISVLPYCSKSRTLAASEAIVELLNGVDVFLGHAPVEDASHRRWWHFCRDRLTSAPPHPLETLHCLYVAAARPHRHALLTTAQWAAVVPRFLDHRSDHIQSTLTLTACARLLRADNGVVERLTSAGYRFPPVDPPPMSANTAASCLYSVTSRTTLLDYIRCGAERLGHAQGYADCADVMQAITRQFSLGPLVHLTTSTLLAITRYANMSTFVETPFFERFVDELMKKWLPRQPRRILTIINNCVIDGQQRALRVFADNKYVDILLVYLVDDDVCVSHRASWLLREIQGRVFAQLLDIIRPMRVALGQQQDERYHQEHRTADITTTTQAVLLETRFATEALTAYIDEAFEPTQ